MSDSGGTLRNLTDHHLLYRQKQLRDAYRATPTPAIAAHLEEIDRELRRRAKMPNLRAMALKVHIEKLSANLLRAYALEMVDMAPATEIEKLVVAFHAQNAVQGIAG